MSLGMVALLAGMGGGYIKGKQQQRENDRQDMQDAWLKEQQDRQRQDWKDQDQLKSDLKGAAAPVAMEQGAAGMIKPDTMDNRDVGLPETASQPNGGLMQGQFKVAGQSYTDKALADKAVADQNAPDAVSQRTAQAYRKNGKDKDAMSIENAVMDRKLKQLGLSEAEAKHADNEYNRLLLKGIDSHPDWRQGIANVLTDTQLGGLKGVTVTPKVSQDGKTVDFVGVNPDGIEKTLYSTKNSPDGRAEFLQHAGRTNFETKLNFVVERAKADKEDSRWQQTFDFNKKKEESDQQYKNRILGFQASQDARAAETHKLAMEDAKVPAAVKMQATSLSKEMDGISAAMNKALAEGLFDPNSANAKALIERQAMLGIKYRQLLEPHMPSAKGKAAPAADPLGLDKPAPGAAVPQAAAAPKPAAAPAQTVPAVSMQQVAPIDPGAQPVRQANEPLQAFKARLIQWDQARMANEDLRLKLESEAQRKMLLQSRPDLAQMGQGLR